MLDLRLAATVSMRQSEEHFLAASPRITVAELERFEEEERARRERDDVRFGLLASAVMQAGGIEREDGERWEPRHFFPHLPAASEESIDLGVNGLLAWVLDANERMGGLDLRDKVAEA